MDNKVLSKKLAEATAKKYPSLSENLYFKKFASEARLEGDISDESDNTDSLGEVYNQILMGVESYIPLSFARNYTTDKSSLLIPVGTYGTATALTSGSFTSSPLTQTPVTIDLDKEYGVEVSWSRAHLEDATWDVLSEQNKYAGYAIQSYLCGLLMAALEGISDSSLAGGDELELSDTGAISWQNVLTLMSYVDVADYGPVNYLLVSPEVYWQLLSLEEFTSSLYAGSDEVMRTGVAKSTMGLTIMRVSAFTSTHGAIALNSNKAIALVTRRNVQVEPFADPRNDEYGFVASTRAKVGVLCPLAVARGLWTPSS